MAGLLLLVVLPVAVFSLLTSFDHPTIGLSVTKSFDGELMIACGEARYEHLKVRSSTEIREYNIVGELDLGEIVPILEYLDGDYVYGDDNSWDKVWWRGAERFVYSQLLQERDIRKCLPKTPSISR